MSSPARHSSRSTSTRTRCRPLPTPQLPLSAPRPGRRRARLRLMSMLHLGAGDLGSVRDPGHADLPGLQGRQEDRRVSAPLLIQLYSFRPSLFPHSVCCSCFTLPGMATSCSCILMAGPLLCVICESTTPTQRARSVRLEGGGGCRL